MKIGISPTTINEINETLREKDQKTLWKNEHETIVGPISSGLLEGQGLKIFEGENGPEKAREEILQIARISSKTRAKIFPKTLRLWVDIPSISKDQGLIMLTLPPGQPLAEILESADSPETKTHLMQLYREETEKEIYTDTISSKDFWYDHDNDALILVSLLNVKPEYLTVNQE